MPRPTNAVAGKALAVEEFFQITVTSHQRKRDPLYHLGYREGHYTVFKQNLPRLNVKRLIDFLNKN
ncbi:MAG: hypothetical protein A2017_18140 [Lentisphaerae bacterium GWF2_44_16]|nr:MAG: hypothetical protein A2017_18140 [Lentisphaerae bacterium GWF2_44_16]